jgi:hypothetical protein
MIADYYQQKNVYRYSAAELGGAKHWYIQTPEAYCGANFLPDNNLAIKKHH